MSETMPVPDSFTIDGTEYDRFLGYIQNWGQTLATWGVAYNFIGVNLPAIGDTGSPGSGNSELDAALLTIANALSKENEKHPNSENDQWRMRAAGGKFDNFHEVLDGFSLKKVGLMDTHCWLPLLGDQNLDNPVIPDSRPYCLDSSWFALSRESNTPKECFIKLPAGTEVAIHDLPAGFPDALSTAGAKLATVSPGASMLEFSQGLSAKGYYLSVPTAPGILSVGGVVAIGGHGSGVSSAASDTMDVPHYAFSSVSNQMVWMDVIAWDGSQYKLTRVSRDDATQDEWSAMACGLGKLFSVRMAFIVYPVTKNNLSARVLQINHFIEAKTLLGQDGSAPGSLQYLAENYGGFEPIQFPGYNQEFYNGEDFVWTKTWSYHPASTDFTDVKVFHKEDGRGGTVASNLKASWYSKVDKPYNYPSTAGISCAASSALVWGLVTAPSGTPVITRVAASKTGDASATGGGYAGTPKDNGKTAIWSDENADVYYFVEPDTVRAFDWSYGVLCAKDEIQKVVNTFYTRSLALLQQFESNGEYPLMAAGEIRLVELDTPPDPAWSYPALSNPSPGLLASGTGPADMVCVYLSWLSSAYQPDYWKFCAQLEDELFFGDSPALGAYAWGPEWSKAWGCSDQGPYTDDAKLDRIRANFDQGANTNGFTNTANQLKASDPQNLFYSKAIGRIFKI